MGSAVPAPEPPGERQALTGWRALFHHPQVLAGTARGALVTVGLLLGLAAITVFNAKSPQNVSLATIVVLIVVVAAWLVGIRALALVVVCGVAGNLSAAAAGGLTWVTAVAASGVALAMAVLGRVAARGVLASDAAAQLRVDIDSERNAKELQRSIHARVVTALLRVTAERDGGDARFFADVASIVSGLVGAERAAFIVLPGPNAVGLDLADLQDPGIVRMPDVPRVDDSAVVIERAAWKEPDPPDASGSAESDADGVAERAFLDALGARNAAVIAPWAVEGVQIGALAAIDPRDGSRFTEAEAQVVEIAAIAAGPAWLLRQATERERRRADELELLSDVARTLAETIELDTVQRLVVSAAARLLEDTNRPIATSLLELTGDAVYPAARAGIGADDPREVRNYALSEHPVLRHVVETSAAWRGAGDTIDLPQDTRELITSNGYHAMAVVPVVVEGTVWGLLTAASPDTVPFSDVHVDRLEALAGLAGLALTNAMRMRSTERVAAHNATLEKAKTEFLNLASHELRGPLTVLRGYLGMAVTGDLGSVPPPLKSVLPVLAQKTAEMATLIDGMLEAARLASIFQ